MTHLKAESYLEEAAVSPQKRSRETAILSAILAVTAVVYFRCLSNAFVLDDVAMIIRNPDLPDWSFLWKAFTRNEFWFTNAGFLESYQFRNYRPLLLVWYSLNYHLFGLHPAAWHASIVAMHLLAVWLVFKISRRLANSSTALLAAAMFALTPVHVAAVVWTAASGMVLGTTLILAAFYLIVTSLGIFSRHWLIAIALYAGALLSHESMTVFPVLVACYAFLFAPSDFSRLTRLRRAIIWQAPFAFELLLYMVTRKLVLGFYVSNPYYLTNLLTNAQAVLTVPIVLATYLLMLVMPWLTLPNHRVFPVSSISSPDFCLPLAALILMGVVLVVVALYHPKSRLYLFCAIWIGVTLAPMLTLHSVPHLVQDYCLYLPSVGWCLLAGDALVGIAQTNALSQRLVFAAVSAMLLVFAVALWKVQWFWHDDVAATGGYVESFPESIRWRWAFASHLDQEGDHAESENEIRVALTLGPDNTGIDHPSSNQLHHYLGELLARRGDIDGASLEFGKSVSGPPDENEEHLSRQLPAHDNDGASLYDRGVSDAKAGRTEQAIEEITQAIAMMKKVPLLDNGPLALRYINLAELYDKQGNQQQVEAVLKEVDSLSEGELAADLARATIRLDHSDKDGAERILLDLSHRYPTSYQVLTMLGDLEFQNKQYAKALDCYNRAGGGWFGGGQLHLSIAQSLHGLGRNREALDQCRLAMALEPHNLAMKFSCAQLGSE